MVRHMAPFSFGMIGNEPDREVLIEMHKARDVLQIESRLAHHYQFLGDGIDTRIALQRPCVALRQLVIETGRHILADLAAGLLYQVEIIRQPLGSRGGRLGVRLELQLPRRCTKQFFLSMQITGQRKGRIGHALLPFGVAASRQDWDGRLVGDCALSRIMISGVVPYAIKLLTTAP